MGALDVQGEEKMLGLDHLAAASVRGCKSQLLGISRAIPSTELLKVANPGCHTTDGSIPVTRGDGVATGREEGYGTCGDGGYCPEHAAIANIEQMLSTQIFKLFCKTTAIIKPLPKLPAGQSFPRRRG